jgi:hypothetical protein
VVPSHELRAALVDAVASVLTPATSTAGPVGDPTERVLTRLVVIGEMVGPESRAIAHIEMDAGGSDLPSWDATALLLQALKEVNK